MILVGARLSEGVWVLDIGRAKLSEGARLRVLDIGWGQTFRGVFQRGWGQTFRGGVGA